MVFTLRLRRILLALYLVVVTAVFLYFGFPSEALRTHAASRLSAALPVLGISVSSLRPSLPAGVTLQGVRIAYEDQPVAVLDRLRVQPELMSLLRPKTVYSFEGALGNGSITGRAEMDSTGDKPKTILNANLSGAMLQQMSFFQNVYGSQLSGRLEGVLSINEAGVLSCKLTLTEPQLELAAPLFDQKTFSFRTAEIDITFQGRTLLLRSGRLKGNDMDAEVSGNIALGLASGGGTMNLNGRLTPHPAFLARAEKGLPANLMRRRTAIPFQVTGPLKAPAVTIN
jgi:type II secretion system protein N